MDRESRQTLEAAPAQADESETRAARPYQIPAGVAAHYETALVESQARAGIASGGSELPHRAAIEASFGPDHGLGGVRAHIGGAAAPASANIGAEAFTLGRDIAFRESPSLHLAAHEAAHVVQQRGGVQLSGGVGQAGDPHERHADAVADAVVAGRSAARLLDEVGGGGAHAAVQRKEVKTYGGAFNSRVFQNISEKANPMSRDFYSKVGVDIVLDFKLAPGVDADRFGFTQAAKPVYSATKPPGAEERRPERRPEAEAPASFKGSAKNRRAIQAEKRKASSRARSQRRPLRRATPEQNLHRPVG